MSWLLFAVLSPAVYSIVIFIDKYILEKEVKDYRGMTIFGSIMALIFGTFFWVGSGFPRLPFPDMLLILLSGALTIWASAFYFKIIASEEASEVMILLQLLPILVLILSVVFLQDIISFKQFLGFVLIFLGAVGVSVKRELKSFRLSSAFFFMLLADFLWALANILFKFVTDTNIFSQVVSYESWGIALGGLALYLFFPSVRHAFNKITKTVSKKALGIIFINEGIFIVSKLCAFLAIAWGSVTLVSVIGSTSVFFGIIYGLILTLILPKVFQENITKDGLLKKFIFALLVFTGIVLIG